MKDRYESIIVEVVSKVMVPLVQIFAIYVITHGHYGPGGGFQGGVILAVSTILLRLSLGQERSHVMFPTTRATWLGAFGMLVFALLGLLPLALGGEFLNYSFLPLPGVSGADLRSLAILVVEVAIGLAVWGTLVTMFDRLTEGVA
jgi:multicomponent Na+:H+ antiporter subunit B